MTTSYDVNVAAQLVAYAARPKERPARNAAYADLVARYLNDEEFAATADTIAAGLGIDIHDVDAEVGLIASATSDSPLRPPLNLMALRAGLTRKALPGVVLLAIAHTAFPVRGFLEDPVRVGYVDIDVVVATLNRLAERALEENPDDVDADRPDQGETWREWLALREARHGQQRSSSGDRRGVVRKVCKFLEDNGHLQAATAGTTWRATPRFRIAVRGVVNDSEWYGHLVGLLNEELASDAPPSPYDDPDDADEVEDEDDL